MGTEKFEVKSAVHARHLDRLAGGNAVTLMDEAGNVVATGEVTRISGTVDQATQSASVYSEVRAVEGGVLRDGRYLSGQVRLEPVTGVVELDAALLTGADASEVFAVQEGRLTPTAVEVVHRDADRVLVAGLSPGTPLLAEPVSGAHAGMLVEVVNQ